MTEEITKEHQEMLKRHEEYEEKAERLKRHEEYKEKVEKAKVTHKTGITGEYEPFRELVCPVMTNVAHSEREIYCRGPLCGHWSPRLNMCGTATMGEMAWTHLEYHKDYQATIEMYQGKEEHIIITLREKLEKSKKLAKEAKEYLSPVGQVNITNCVARAVWANERITEIIKLTTEEEEEE